MTVKNRINYSIVFYYVDLRIKSEGMAEVPLISFLICTLFAGQKQGGYLYAIFEKFKIQCV